MKKDKNDKKKEALKVLRHTAEHILMQAMDALWPGKIIKAMGPATDDGLYFDFEIKGDLKITVDDFLKIESEIDKIVEKDLPLIRKEVSVKEARGLFKANPYKQEWLDEIEKRGEKATIYYTGGPGSELAEPFVDLCSGPHLKSTGQVVAVKLLSVAGAYWHGDEKNKMLTRIYGTAFPDKKSLVEYLKMIEEVKKRDHRKIGKELDLFSFHPAGQADVFWHHKGYLIFKELVEYWRWIHDREGYLEVRTPEILTKAIWDQSGHTKNFLHKMYRVLTPESKEWDMCIKPMNCDGGMLIYQTKQWSYRDFPLKVAELGVVHRYESSGEVLGIIRPREFTQDDAHIYCTPEQIKEELKKVIDLSFEVYQTFGLELDHLELSTRPENSIGSDQVWERAESIMRQVLKENDIRHQINEGDGAFYGPKFDFHLKDAIGRTWQCATIQLDFAQPENFDLEYVTKKGVRERPVMIHRTLYGSVERFLGILIENYAGAFPVWLSPVQAVVLPVTKEQNDYAEKVFSSLKEVSIRVELDGSHNTLSYRIRQAEIQKVPYIIVVGAKEVEGNFLAVRKRSSAKIENQTLAEFLKMIKEKIKERSLEI
ncbi:MAG: threonine--tRNA ligase [Patescibacteria group bacterium]|nr:threonine--tRNA ligase [Patescibacteria group bacterium]